MKWLSVLINPTFNLLAYIAHAAVFYSLLMTVYFFWGHHAAAVATVDAVVYGLAKEFWFDLKYEKPEVSGGLKGGALDLLTYLIGIAAFWIVVR